MRAKERFVLSRYTFSPSISSIWLLCSWHIGECRFPTSCLLPGLSASYSPRLHKKDSTPGADIR